MRVIGVIGAGQMGAGIAQVTAAAGYDVRLSDRDLALATRGHGTIERALTRLVDKGKVEATAAEAILSRIIPTADSAAFADADLVIEAATEHEEIKRAIFAEVGAILRPDALLASNTSSISITRLAQAAPDPARFVGVHFFNPVPVMPLIELIAGLGTSDATLTSVAAFGESLGKTIVHAQDAPGFIANRVLLPMINEAIFALGEGVASIGDIDATCRLGLNHPMGPLTLADFIGLDTCLAILRVLEDGSGDQKFRPAPLLIRYVDAGWLGKKTGRGFYDWTGDLPVPTR
jgi:3-hydroxybutyryl-CoA dehydrogenase